MTSYKNQPIVKQELEIANRKCKTILNINVYFFQRNMNDVHTTWGKKRKSRRKKISAILNSRELATSCVKTLTNIITIIVSYSRSQK